MSETAGHTPMWLDVHTATPGQSVSVHFRAGQKRGLGYTLSLYVSDRWEVRYLLCSDGNGDEPTWWGVEEAESRFVPAVGVVSETPDRVVFPESAPPGDYRLCNGSSPTACVQVTVRSSA